MTNDMSSIIEIITASIMEPTIPTGNECFILTTDDEKNDYGVVIDGDSATIHEPFSKNSLNEKYNRTDFISNPMNFICSELWQKFGKIFRKKFCQHYDFSGKYLVGKDVVGDGLTD